MNCSEGNSGQTSKVTQKFTKIRHCDCTLCVCMHFCACAWIHFIKTDWQRLRKQQVEPEPHRLCNWQKWTWEHSTVRRQKTWMLADWQMDGTWLKSFSKRKVPKRKPCKTCYSCAKWISRESSQTMLNKSNPSCKWKCVILEVYSVFPNVFTLMEKPCVKK